MKEPHFGFCPYCEKNTLQAHVFDEKEDFEIGEIIVQFDADYFVCEECGGMYDNPRNDYDPLTQIYAEYERITGKKWKGIYK